MSFPNELPKDAITELLSLFKGEKPDVGRIALSAYDLAGYGLYVYFGDVKYLMGVSSDAVDIFNKLTELLSQLNLADLPKYAEVLAYVADLQAKGYSVAGIAFRVTLKYGPSVTKLIVQLIAIFKGL